MRGTLISWMLLLLVGCGHRASRNIDPADDLPKTAETKETKEPTEATDTTENRPAQRGAIDIYVAGDLESKNFADGLSGQTPQDYQIAISAYYVQQAADDPSPVRCFDYGDEPVVVEMDRDNLVGECQISAVPTAIYTHGRTKVAWVRYSVNVSLSYLGGTYPGKLSFFRAYSDTTYKGRAYRAGEGTVRFSGLIDVEVPYFFFPPALPNTGARQETVAGEYWLTFGYSKPLPIVQSNTDSHWARFHWSIAEGFRWADRPAPGYTDSVWDLNVLGGGEEVLVPGVTGYYTTSSLY